MGAMFVVSPGTESGNMALFNWAPALVERHARYSTRDLGQAQRHLHGLHDSISLSLDRPGDFISYDEVLMTMGDMVVTMGCINSTTGYDLRFQSRDEYLITIPLRGSGWASTGEMFVEYGRDDIMIVAPACSVRKHWHGPGQVLSVHVPAARFDAAMAKLPHGNLPPAPILRIGSRRLRSFLRVIDMVCADLNDHPGSSPFLRDPLAEQIEDVLLTLLLEQLPHDAAAQPIPVGTSPAVPYYVRRAEDFIAANAHRDIGIDDMAGAAGVSLRTIQYGFRKYRDITPMLYLKRIRYERARALLLSDETPRRRISDVAAEIGCANISQFSRDYRTLFGETPSQTMAAPRRLVG